MSGLCGIIDLGGTPVDDDHVERMRAAAAHRGPDGTGRWRGDGGAIVHLALHVTPESVRERQPCVDAASGVVLVADARIDNRQELIAALSEDRWPGGTAAAGGPTDADLILAAYLRWGDEGTRRLIGDFAFVIWDPRRRRVYAARDAMGIRPLHYRWNGRRLWFASDTAQILAVPGFAPTLFEPALAAHLLGRFEHQEWTCYTGIDRLPPAHALVVDEGGLTTARFWHVDPEHSLRYRRDEEYAEHFREVFAEAVENRIRTTHPVGIMLSGGVDSGAIASIAGRLIRDGGVGASDLRAFCWAFESLTAADERHISDLIIEHYALSSTNVPADDLWPLSTYPAHGPSVDDPFFGVYEVLLEHALALARTEGTRIMLSGNRGDLLVGGDVHDASGMIRAGQFRTLAADVGLYRRWMRIPTRTAAHRLIVAPLVADVGALPFLLPLRAAWRRRRPPRAAALPPWVRSDFVERSGFLDAAPPFNEPPEELRGAARRQRYGQIFSGMQMSSLLRDDRMHARAGMQFADPWSDRRLTELVLAMPQRVIQVFAEPKRIAREAMRGVMPEEVRQGATKISPYPLFRRALDEEATGVIEDLIKDSISASLGFVDEVRLLEHYADVRRGAREDGTFWWALSLEMWLRRHT